MKKNTKQQQTKSQQTNQQPAAHQTAAQTAAAPTQPPVGKPQMPFQEQLETERQRRQQSKEISAVAGVDIGDKRSYLRLVGLDGELIEEVQIPTRPERSTSWTGTLTSWERSSIRPRSCCAPPTEWAR